MSVLWLNKIRHYIKEHLSFLVIVIGGLSFLCTNILLKEVLDAADYGVYSLIVTFISIVFIYGLLGFEQVFLRYSKYIKSGKLSTQKYMLHYVGVILLILTAVIIVFYTHQYSQYYDRVWLIVLAIVATIFSLFLFNVFRLNHEFVKAQFLANSWKIFLLFLSISFLFFKNNNVNLLLDWLLGAIVLITIIATIIAFSKIEFQFEQTLTNKDVKLSFFNFFISISTLSMLLFGDRLIVEEYLGVVVLGDYFYLCNLVLAPFTLLQSYVGFRQLIRFKDEFTLPKFNKFNKRILALSVLLSVAILLFIYLVSFFDILQFSFQNYIITIFLLVGLGIIRLYSASILSAFEAQTSIRTLKKTNIYVILFSIVLLIICSFFFYTLNNIIIGFILLWFGRTMIYKYMLINQFNNA